MLNKLYLYFLGTTLCILPLFYSLQTQQIFSVNKFTLILFFLGTTGLLFSSSFLYKKNRVKISQNTAYFTLILSCILAVSTYFSDTPIISFFGSDSRHFGALFIVALLFTFFFTSAVLQNKNNNKHSRENTVIIPFIFIPLTIAGILSSLWAILQYAGHPPIFEGILNFKSLSLRSFAGMGQPNFCAQFLVFPFFIACYFLIKSSIARNKTKIFLSIQLLFLYIIALYATGSRAGILGFLAGISVLITTYIAFKYAHKSNTSKYILQSGIGIIITGILSLFILILVYGDDISLFLGGRGDSIAARFYFWNDAIKLIQEHFWTGTGPDMMGGPLAQSLSVQALEPENFSATPDRTHSVIFDIFLQYGIFGFLFFIFGVWKIIQTALHNIHNSFKKTTQEIDILSLISLASFIGILTTWIFGFAVITDSFITIIFIALIFRRSLSQNIKYITLKSRYITIIFSIFIALSSLFFIHTAYTIHQSEKALFPLRNNAQLSTSEKYYLSEKVLKTPYLENNLLSVYSKFTPIQKQKAEKLAEKYNFHTSSYYQIKIFLLLQQNKIQKAQRYLHKLQKNAGNLFTKQIQVTRIAKSYNLISKEEFTQQMKYITNTLIPKYYFISKNQKDAKFQKFWKHHRQNVQPLMKYKD